MQHNNLPLFYVFVFYVFAIIAVASAIAFVTRKSPVAAALWLVNTMFNLAGLYVMLDAPFLGVIQVIVYAGAIMVLFVFAIMVLIPGKEETGPDPRRVLRLWALPFGAALLVLVAWRVMRGAGASPPAGAVAAPGGVEAIGRLLFTDYLFPFELTSVLLLAAMVGVLLLARRRA
jgi:NADH-quinone oxidoreductase subunit J